jgi:protein SFI1
MGMWRDELRKRRGALLLAAQVDAVQTQHKALMVWRGTVRMHGKMGKHARMAERYFVLRRAWARWGELGREKERERKVRAFESAKVGKVFAGWLEKARRRRRLDLAENQVGMTVAAVGVLDLGIGKLDSMLME